MHEATLAQSIIEQVQNFLEQNSIAEQVKTISLQIGRLSSVIPENLKYFFEILAADKNACGATAFKNTQLEIKVIAIKCYCPNCQKEFDLEESKFICPFCQNFEIEILTGQELFIESLELQ